MYGIYIGFEKIFSAPVTVWCGRGPMEIAKTKYIYTCVCVSPYIRAHYNIIIFNIVYEYKRADYGAEPADELTGERTDRRTTVFSRAVYSSRAR